MQHLSTAVLIIAVVIVVNQGDGVAGQHSKNNTDQVAEEAKNDAIIIVEGPKYVNKMNKTLTIKKDSHISDKRPPSKPPILTLDKRKPKYVEISRPRGQIMHKIPPRQYTKAIKIHSPNSLYKFPRVIPLPQHHRSHYYTKQSTPHQQLTFAASTNKGVVVKSPKFSLPVQTVNGIITDFIRPPKHVENTTAKNFTTTTQRPLRNKRIWPKRLLEKMNITAQNNTGSANNMTASNKTSTSTNDTDLATSATIHHFRYVTAPTTTSQSSTTRGYRQVTRIPKKKYTTPASNITRFKSNDWIPIIPSHYPKSRRSKVKINKRSDVMFVNPDDVPSDSKQTLYLHTYGLVPVSNRMHNAPDSGRKNMVFFRKRKRQLNPLVYSGYSAKAARAPRHYVIGDLHSEASHPRVVTKIKHHHHHHHHRYIKTVDKPVKVPYKVEVPKPYPVPVEKKVPVPVEKIKVVEKPVPYPITIEKKVPYPVEIKVPQPIPVKVVEKEYVPKPYPIVHHVPIVKHVEIKVPHPIHVEKKVPYPVEIKVPYPVDRPVPVPVQVEKQVPYPVPVKVLVPQPYPVEKRVPYPVEVKVKEPVEVIKHVPVKVPVPQPYAVKVPHPVPVHVEKKVPYPVEVEKKVPVPVKVLVPQKVEIEKKLPVYVPKPYPVEKKVPVPVRVPYPVQVPVEVPVEVPVYIQPYHYEDEHVVTGGVTVTDELVTKAPFHTVTVHGNSGFTGFQSRSDKIETTTTTPELSLS